MKGKTRWFKGGKLVAWTDRRCDKCGRFIGKFQWDFCTKCLKKIRKERKLPYVKEYYQKNKEIIRKNKILFYWNNPEYREKSIIRKRILRNANRYNIGDHIEC